MNGGTWVDGDGDGDCDPGEGIEYVITVRNTGTVTVGGTKLYDELLGDLVDCGAAPQGRYLAPNASMTCTGTYQVRQRAFCSKVQATCVGFCERRKCRAVEPSEMLGKHMF